MTHTSRLTTTTHINFRGQAREALDFYRSVFGGQQLLVTYGQAGASKGPETDDLILWGQVTSDEGFGVMAFDIGPDLEWNPGLNAYYVSVRSDSETRIRALWQGLSAGATVRQPLAASAWAPLYGMLVDRFGVVWVLDVVSAGQPA
jgi:PhnB protein